MASDSPDFQTGRIYSQQYRLQQDRAGRYAGQNYFVPQKEAENRTQFPRSSLQATCSIFEIGLHLGKGQTEASDRNGQSLLLLPHTYL